MDASEALLLSERNREGYGYGGGMFLWVIVLVLIFFAFGWGGNRGWGNNDNLAAALAAQGRTQDLAQVERDVLETSCKTQSDVFTTACATQKEILENRYAMQLGFQAAQAQQYQCCCELKTAIHAEGEQTRAMMQNETIQNLRDQNEQLHRQQMVNELFAAQQAQTLNLINTLLPRAVPAYPSCSPYMAAFAGMYNNNGGCCGGCNNSCC